MSYYAMNADAVDTYMGFDGYYVQSDDVSSSSGYDGNYYNDSYSYFSDDSGISSEELADLEELDAARKQAAEDSWDVRFNKAWQGGPGANSQVLNSLRMEFEIAARQYGRTIISEMNLPDKDRSIHASSLGGVAGGDKYTHRGILFKFAVDVEIEGQWLYGGIKPNVAAASKASGNELKNANALIKEILVFKRCSEMAKITLMVPFMCIVDFRGWRLTCQALCPIEGNRTLVYGTRDAAHTIKSDLPPHLAHFVQEICSNLNLAKHGVLERSTQKLVCMHTAADVEIHQSATKEQTFYMIDLARLLPPVLPPKGRHTDIWYHVFRVEFMRKHATAALSSDLFSAFGQPDAGTQIKLGRAATQHLLQQVIPDVARKLRPHEDLSIVLQQSGVNLRFLGLVRTHAADPQVRQVLLEEILARTVKCKLRALWRDCPMESESQAIAVQWINKIYAVDESSALFRTLVNNKYSPFCGGAPVLTPRDVLSALIDVHRTVQKLARQLNLIISDSAKPPLSILDVVLAPRVKSLHIFSIPEAETLRSQALLHTDLPQESLKLLRGAQQLLHHEILSDPNSHDLRARLARVSVDILRYTGDAEAIERAKHDVARVPEQYQDRRVLEVRIDQFMLSLQVASGESKGIAERWEQVQQDRRKLKQQQHESDALVLLTDDVPVDDMKDALFECVLVINTAEEMKALSGAVKRYRSEEAITAMCKWMLKVGSSLCRPYMLWFLVEMGQHELLREFFHEKLMLSDLFLEPSPPLEDIMKILNPSLHELSLRDMTFLTDNQLDTITSKLTNTLQTLDLSGCHSLTKVPHLHGVTRLDVSYCVNISAVPYPSLDSLTCCGVPLITRIDTETRRLTVNFCRRLASIVYPSEHLESIGCPELEVQFRSPSVTAVYIPKTTPETATTHLTSLGLRAASFENTDALFSLHLDALHSLDVSRTSFLQADVDKLFARCSQLRHFKAKHCAGITKVDCSQLLTVDLSYTGVLDLGPLSEQVQRIACSVSRFTLTSAQHLLELKLVGASGSKLSIPSNWPKLELIHLTGCKISEKMIGLILSNAPQLKDIAFTQMKSFTGSCFEKLSGDLYRIKLHECRKFVESYLTNLLYNCPHLDTLLLYKMLSLTDETIRIASLRCPLIRTLRVQRDFGALQCTGRYFHRFRYCQTLQLRNSCRDGPWSINEHVNWRMRELILTLRNNSKILECFQDIPLRLVYSDAYEFSDSMSDQVVKFLGRPASRFLSVLRYSACPKIEAVVDEACVKNLNPNCDVVVYIIEKLEKMGSSHTPMSDEKAGYHVNLTRRFHARGDLSVGMLVRIRTLESGTIKRKKRATKGNAFVCGCGDWFSATMVKLFLMRHYRVFFCRFKHPIYQEDFKKFKEDNPSVIFYEFDDEKELSETQGLVDAIKNAGITHFDVGSVVGSRVADQFTYINSKILHEMDVLERYLANSKTVQQLLVILSQLMPFIGENTKVGVVNNEAGSISENRSGNYLDLRMNGAAVTSLVRTLSHEYKLRNACIAAIACGPFVSGLSGEMYLTNGAMVAQRMDEALAAPNVMTSDTNGSFLRYDGSLVGY